MPSSCIRVVAYNKVHNKGGGISDKRSSIIIR